MLSGREVQPLTIGRTRYALTYRDGQFGALAATCNHVGGPLGEGTLEGEYVVCPWHQWRFHCQTGRGEPGFEEDSEFMVSHARPEQRYARGGRKAHQLDTKAQL